MKEAGETMLTSNINEELKKISDAQIEEIKNNAAQMRQHALLKEKEEEELVKVLKDYKAKFNEFEKATKKTAASQKTMEKELKLFINSSEKLSREKTQTIKRIGFEDGEVAEQQIKEISEKWEAEKETLEKERDRLKDLCA
jgi:hypothetical protein